MQLKLKRSQKTGGIMATNVIFCLDARIEFTPSEAEDVSRYKLSNQVIYNSEASKRHLARADAASDGSMRGSVKGLVSVAMAAMKLNVSVASLQRGQHIECKTLEELMGAEEAIMDACRNLRSYLQTASAFDGRVIVIDFNQDEPTVVASSAPAQQIAAPAPIPSLPAAPQLSAPEEPATPWAPEPPAQEYAEAEYTPIPEFFGIPFDWSDQNTRARTIAAGIVLAILLFVVLPRFI